MLDILDIPNTFLKSLFSSGTTFFIHRCSVLIAQPHLALDASRHIRASLGAAKPHNPNPTEKATDTRHASNSPHSPHSSHGQFARPGPGPARDRPAAHMESLGILGPNWPSPRRRLSGGGSPRAMAGSPTSWRKRRFAGELAWLKVQIPQGKEHCRSLAGFEDHGGVGKNVEAWGFANCMKIVEDDPLATLRSLI